MRRLTRIGDKLSTHTAAIIQSPDESTEIPPGHTGGQSARGVPVTSAQSRDWESWLCPARGQGDGAIPGNGARASFGHSGANPPWLT